MAVPLAIYHVGDGDCIVVLKIAHSMTVEFLFIAYFQ